MIHNIINKINKIKLNYNKYKDKKCLNNLNKM
jgi:hypothetical protein